MRTDIQAIVLAAGKSTRLNSNKTKFIEKICGQALIIYPLAVLDELSITTTLVVGFQADMIKNIVQQHYPQMHYIEQAEQLGTAHATKLTRPAWHTRDILIMKADTPLITSATIENLYKKHKETNATISFIAAHNSDPSNAAYNRVIKQDAHIYIRKKAELSFAEMQEHCCVNSGIYLIEKSFLEKHINTIIQNKHTNEFHLSDLVNHATQLGKTVTMVLVPFDQIRGIHSYQELWAIEQIKRSELIRYWMERGVRFSAAQTAHIDLDVVIGSGSFIGCSVHLLNGTQIGNNSTISHFSIIEHATLGNHVTVHPHSIVRHSTIGDHSEIGPFAHLQTNTTVGTHCVVGNFVETKRTAIGDNSKAKHLSYLGDTYIGSQVNIGAGTITCNYDGKNKHTTHIEDNVFIGSNNSLVAPVIIEAHAFTAAGSVITQNVPAQALAIARARQVNKEGYTKKMQETATKPSATPIKKQPLSFLGAMKSNDSIIDQ